MYKLPFLIIFLLGISLIPYSFSEEVPDWVKSTAGWWSDRIISQNEFTSGLEFLIGEGIILISDIEPGIPGPDKIIPDWVRNTAGWWSDNRIPDSEFINAMKYLIETGIIEVNISSPDIIKNEIIDEPINQISPLNIVLDANKIVHANKNFIMNVKVFDEKNYSGNEYSIHRKGLDGVDVNIQLFTQAGELIHDYDAITKYAGLVEYEIHAKETSQYRGLWLINNNYTVKITATLGEQYDEKSLEFVGVPSEYAYTQG